MFTRDSRKLRLSLAALASCLLAYLAVSVSLGALAHSLETRDRVYPYKSEDWLRYLLPSFFAEGPRPKLLLTGPSTARENFLVETFRPAFPTYRVLPGGLSLGTLEDVLASLEYVERVYGTRAMPEMVVLGLSPRFVAEIPTDRPFARGLDDYSRAFGTRKEGARLVLQPKSLWEGLVAEFRFRTRKQAPRYQVALLWIVRQCVPGWLDDALTGSSLSRAVAGSPIAGLVGIDTLLDRGLRGRIDDLVSPYKYRGARRFTAEGLARWLDDPNSFWFDVYRWDPAADATRVQAAFARLDALVERHGISLFVVNLPERELSRVRYDPAHYEAYGKLIRSALGNRPLLDLRETLRDEEFHDAEHALEEGAARMSRLVVQFMRPASGS